MKKLNLTIIIIFTALNFALSQEIKTPEKNKYIYNESIIKLKDMVPIMEKHPVALGKLKSARTQEIFSYITAISGGFVLGRALGKGISGNYTDVLIDEIGIGLGLIGLTVILDSSRKKNIKRAVNIYNSSLTLEPPKMNESTLGLKISDNNIKLVFSF